MKKIGIILTIAIALTLVAGCASSGGGGGSSSAASSEPAAAPYSVDLSSLTYDIFNRGTKKLVTPGKGTKNTTALGAQYDGVLFYLSGITADVTQYRRVTVNAKCYDASGKEISPKDGNAMVVFVYDTKGDLEGPDMGPGKNTPLKEFNLGGSGSISKPNGSRINLTQAPGAVLIQASSPSVKFIEITEVTLHNGRDN
jgi:hypothetical protein